MAKYISNELADLIKAQGYAQGAVLEVQKEIDHVNQEIADLRYEIDRLNDVVNHLGVVGAPKRAHLAQLNKKIRKLAPNLDLTVIHPRTALRASRRWRYGQFNACLSRLIKAATGEVTTTEVLLRLAEELALPLTPEENYLRHRNGVRRQLSRWADLGLLERLHDPRKSFEGRWRFVRAAKPADPL